jgi:hypothetical protein
MASGTPKVADPRPRGPPRSHSFSHSTLLADRGRSPGTYGQQRALPACGVINIRRERRMSCSPTFTTASVKGTKRRTTYTPAHCYANCPPLHELSGSCARAATQDDRQFASAIDKRASCPMPAGLTIGTGNGAAGHTWL